MHRDIKTFEINRNNEMNLGTEATAKRLKQVRL